MTTWTTASVPTRSPEPAAVPAERWACLNCDEVNDAQRRRCRDCGTRRSAGRLTA